MKYYTTVQVGIYSKINRIKYSIEVDEWNPETTRF